MNVYYYYKKFQEKNHCFPYYACIAEGNTGVVISNYFFLNIVIAEEYLRIYHLAQKLGYVVSDDETV